MEAPHPGVAGGAWDENVGEDGQCEADVDGGGLNGPELDGGAALLPSLLPLQLPALLSRPSLLCGFCLLMAGEAEG